MNYLTSKDSMYEFAGPNWRPDETLRQLEKLWLTKLNSETTPPKSPEKSSQPVFIEDSYVFAPYSSNFVSIVNKMKGTEK